MEELSLILWRERELLEALLYRLEVEKLVLASGQNRWLAPAARDVEAVLEELRETELLRAVTADEAARSLGLDANPSLRALAESAAEPWPSILLDHREVLLRYTEEIAAAAAANRELLAAGQQNAREVLLGATSAPASYAADGTVVVDERRTRLLDRSI